MTELRHAASRQNRASRNADLDAALAELCRSKEQPPSTREQNVVKDLRESILAASIWSSLTSSKRRLRKPVDHLNILRFIVSSVEMVEAPNPPILHSVLKDAERVYTAFRTLILFYAGKLDVCPSSVKGTEPSDGNRRTIEWLLELESAWSLPREFEIGDAALEPLVEKTRAPGDKALNFSYCLAFLLDRSYGAPFEDFAVGIAEVLYGQRPEKRSLQRLRRKRREFVERAAARFSADNTLAMIFGRPVTDVRLPWDSSVASGLLKDG